MRTLFSIITLFIVVVTTSAQRIGEFRYGLFANVQANMHTADFKELPGLPSCCEHYSSGFGIRGGIGLQASLGITPSWALGARADFSSLGATLTFEEHAPIIVFPQDALTDGIIEHSIAASLPAIGIEPIIIYKPSELSVWGGPRITYIVDNSFVQREEILEPSSAVFDDTRQKVRNERRGTIPTFNALQLGLSIGASYDLPLNSNNTVILQPQLSYTHHFTSMLGDLNWQAHALRLGAAIVFGQAPYVSPRRELEPRETEDAPLAPAPLRTSLSLTAIDVNGKRSDRVTITVEETIATRMHPLLHYVFFEANSATLPVRYTVGGEQGAALFNPERIRDTNALDIYHRVLDIVGFRMRARPNTTITLTGTTSSADADPTVASRRAVAVKNYLFNAWGIAPSRIQLTSQGLPSVPSTEREPAGIEENQRVEITANDISLFDPIIITDTLRSVNPPTVVIAPRVNREQIMSWKITTAHDASVLREFNGVASLPTEVAWDVRADAYKLTDTTKSLTLKLIVADSTQTAAVDLRVPTDVISLRRKRVEHRGIYAYDRYDLILFDFDKATLSPSHNRALKLIDESINQNAIVVISGYTDLIGDSLHNAELSCSRARAAFDALGKRGEVRCMGEAPEHDVTTPEGRFYSRMVRVEVSTPSE